MNKINITDRVLNKVAEIIGTNACWIPVKEQLPSDGQLCFFQVTGTNDVYAGTFKKLEQKDSNTNSKAYLGTFVQMQLYINVGFHVISPYKDYEVSHWMPLYLPKPHRS